MSTSTRLPVKTLGLFERRVDGDDCLMKLASRRFLQARMGAEMHAATRQQLEWLMSFRPWPDAPVVLHLPRDLSLVEEATQEQVLGFAGRYAGKLHGMVLHDDQAMVLRKEEYLNAARRMDAELHRMTQSPMLFIEYAAGLEPEDFVNFFSKSSDLARVSACIDISHVGIRAARAAYAKTHHNEDVCALKTQPAHLPQLMPSVDAAVTSGRSVAIDLVEAICAVRKPVHFHLHDGHPLSTFSPFGVSDHLSFFAEIPLHFEHQGRCAVGTMFGPSGLVDVVSRAIGSLGPGNVSLTLEIHPTDERLALGDAADLFDHWTDKTNAEKMNHWLSILTRNHSLLLRTVELTTDQLRSTSTH
jgi:hypothetical protein